MEKDIVLVAIILSDNFMSKLSEILGGYIVSIDELYKWSQEYINLYQDVTDWDKFLENNKTCGSWDEHVINFGNIKLNTYL